MRSLFKHHNLPAWLVLLASLGITTLVSRGLWQQIDAAAEKQFSLRALGIADDIAARLRQHEQILLGGAGLFDASDKVTRGEWRTYVERLRLQQQYPGIQGVGFSQVIQPAALPAHVAALRAEGFPEYTVRPPGERPLYTSIVYLEPFTGRNLAAFGFDMFSEATRNKAMSHAAATGQTAISGKVKLLQETHGKPQAGFLMYVPVYAKANLATGVGTAAARWQSLRGFVFSPYRINNLMRGILGEVNSALDFVIHDGTDISAETLMYASVADHSPDPPAPPRYAAKQRIAAYGHVWTISLHSRPAYEAQHPFTLTWLVLLLGGGISLSLFALTTSLVSRRDKALALANDMTARIRDSEQRFRDIIETSPTAARISLGGRVVFYNARYAELLNVPRDLAEGVDPSTYYANRDVYEDVLARLGRGERVLDRLVELSIPGAGTKWTLASYFPIEFDGAPAVLGWFHDITRQRAAEDEIGRSRKLLADVLDAASSSIIATDPAGLITIFNRGAERMLGYTAAEMVGRQTPAIIHVPAEVVARGEELTAMLGHQVAGFRVFVEMPERGDVEQREWTYVRKDGTQLLVTLAVTVVRDPVGVIIGYLGIAEDITERKRVDRMKSEFVSTVSHELRTPLTSISGALGLLVGEALGPLPGQVKQMLDIAHKNSLRLSHLIDDLLDMEKIAAGKMRFDMQPHAIMPLLEQAVELNRAYGEQHDVGFVITERHEEMVLVDGQRLVQILSNFLSNAAKFSPAGINVELAVSHLDGMLRIAVTDHGPGIPPDFRDRIFQKFSQADSSDTRQKGGTGLGLAISRELAERMGGRVGFESTQGRGSTFFCEFPLQP